MAARQLASRARRRIQMAPKAPNANLGEQREVVTAFLRALRSGDLEGMITVLDPDVVVRLDAATARAGGRGEIRGARTWAKGAMAFSRFARSVEPMLVDGRVGLVWAPKGKLERVLKCTVAGGKIIAMELLADPVHLRLLKLALVPAP
jgi:RNA polymerase sigma-70 factor (ECF subfamily)